MLLLKYLITLVDGIDFTVALFMQFFLKVNTNVADFGKNAEFVYTMVIIPEHLPEAELQTVKIFQQLLLC